MAIIANSSTVVKINYSISPTFGKNVIHLLFKFLITFPFLIYHFFLLIFFLSLFLFSFVLFK